MNNRLAVYFLHINLLYFPVTTPDVGLQFLGFLLVLGLKLFTFHLQFFLSRVRIENFVIVFLFLLIAVSIY